MKQFSAIIFDMDGVLVDSEPFHDRAWEALFAELGHAHDHGIVFNEYIGRSDKILLRDLIARHHLPHDIEALVQRKLDHLLQFLREHRPIFAELHELVPELARTHRLGIATSASHTAVDVVMDISGVRKWFGAIVGAEDIQRVKPDPEVYLTAAARLGVAPANCCAIEDTPVGIAAAKAAGMTVIGLASSLPPERLQQADFVARNHAEVRSWLLG